MVDVGLWTSTLMSTWREMKRVTIKYTLNSTIHARDNQTACDIEESCSVNMDVL